MTVEPPNATLTQSACIAQSRTCTFKQGSSKCHSLRPRNQPTHASPHSGLLCNLLFTPPAAACSRVEAVSVRLATKNDASVPYASAPLACPLVWSLCCCAEGELVVASGDANSWGSNQFPLKSKKHVLAQEQEEQKRTIRRAEQ